MRSILSLDVPLLLRVFSFLATVDKQRVAATCRHLSKLVAEPSLWTRANLRSLARASRAQLAQLLTTRRYSLLRALDLSDCAAVPVAELLAWCRDARAFQPAYLTPLVACLQVGALSALISVFVSFSM